MIVGRALKTLRFQVKLRYGDQGVIFESSKIDSKIDETRNYSGTVNVSIFYRVFILFLFLLHKTLLELLNPSWSS